MAKRSVASATISFGLVSIPVKFYLTASPESVHFNMITPSGNRVKQLLVDAVTGEEVDRSTCQKGYEYAKGQFVIFTPEELKSLGDNDGGSMEIVEFIPVDSLNVLEIEKSHYLDVGKGGDKAYRLFVAALKKLGKLGVAQWTNRGRQHLVILGVQGECLVAHQMFYKSEVREFELDCAKYDPREIEVDMACKLIDALSTESYDSSKYKNTYVERVETAASAKCAGKVVNDVKEPTAKQNSDLFVMLQASLAKTKAA